MSDFDKALSVALAFVLANYVIRPLARAIERRIAQIRLRRKSQAR